MSLIGELSKRCVFYGVWSNIVCCSIVLTVGILGAATFISFATIYSNDYVQFYQNQPDVALGWCKISEIQPGNITGLYIWKVRVYSGQDPHIFQSNYSSELAKTIILGNNSLNLNITTQPIDPHLVGLCSECWYVVNNPSNVSWDQSDVYTTKYTDSSETIEYRHTKYLKLITVFSVMAAFSFSIILVSFLCVIGAAAYLSRKY